MTTTTVSPKFQVVIPKSVRESLHLKPGTKFEVLSYKGCIEFIPIRPMKEMRGSLKGMDTHIEREREDRV